MIGKKHCRATWLLLLLSIALSAGAQSSGEEAYDDIILLNNGGRYYGRIIEVIDDDKVIIEQKDELVIDVPFDKIYALTDSAGYDSVRAEFEVNRPPVKPKIKPKVITSVGFFAGGGTTDMLVSVLGSHRLAENFYFGGGLEWAGTPDEGYASLLIEARLSIKSGGWRPFLYLETGFPLGGSGRNYEGSPRLESGAGLLIPGGSQLTINGRLGLRINHQGHADDHHGLALTIGFII